MRQIIGYIAWSLFIWYEVNRNYRMIEVEKVRPNYWHSFGVRAFFGILGIATMIPSDIDPVLCLYDLIVDIPQYWRVSPLLVVPLILTNPIVLILIAETTSFSLIFDPWLNKKRGRRWNYRGKNSGWIDKLKLGFYYAFKILCLLGFIYSTIMIWINF